MMDHYTKGLVVDGLGLDISRKPSIAGYDSGPEPVINALQAVFAWAQRFFAKADQRRLGEIERVGSGRHLRVVVEKASDVPLAFLGLMDC